MDDFYSRTYGIFGDSLDKIIASHVAVVGLGGVGGQAAVALARSGVGKLTLVDGDKVVRSNLNRQEVAYESTLGMTKTEACARLIRDINPSCELKLFDSFWTSDNRIDLTGVSYILDCIDSVGAKADLIKFAHDNDIPIISALGAGNKIDPTRLRVSDINKTHTDPLAKVMRKKLRDMGINHTKVVFSDEEPRIRYETGPETDVGDYKKRVVPASCSFVPTVMGLIMAGEVLKDISGIS